MEFKVLKDPTGGLDVTSASSQYPAENMGSDCEGKDPVLSYKLPKVALSPNPKPTSPKVGHALILLCCLACPSRETPGGSAAGTAAHEVAPEFAESACIKSV